MSHKVPEVFQELVSRVMRTFYEPKFIIVMSLLNKVDWLRDEELARKLILPTKEVQKICSRLKEEGFIYVIQRNEQKEKSSRAIPRTYYAVNYSSFINIVKWKITKITESIKNRMDQKAQQRGYQCKICKKIFSIEDALAANNYSTALFMCDVCPNSVLDVEEEKKRGLSPQQALALFKEQTSEILKLLKKTEEVEVVLTRETLTQAMSKKEQAQKRAANGEIAFAQDKGGNITKITVILAENDRATKEELEAELEKKRQQNAMPIWFVKSTIRKNEFQNHKRKVEIETGSGSAEAVKKINKQLDEEKKRIEKQLKYEKRRQKFYENYYESIYKIVDNQQ